MFASPFFRASLVPFFLGCVFPLFQNGGQLVKTEYDAAKDVTRITLNPIILASRRLEELRLGAIAGYPGKVKSKPKDVTLVFLSLSKTDENRYEVARKLTIVADERHIDLGETQRSKQAQNGLFIETMVGTIPLDDFLMVSKAKQVRIRLGITEVALVPAHMNALKLMASYLVD